MAKKNSKVILVCGATGRQGGAAVRHLRDKGFEVRALTRDPSGEKARALVGRGTEVVRGDLDDPASLSRALDGADGVYSVQPYGLTAEQEIRQGVNLIDAASRARVGHFVYSSVAGANLASGVPLLDCKFEIENHLRGTGLRYTILRPVSFMENLLMDKASIDGGVLPRPLRPETQLELVAVDDIGALVAMAFARPGHWQGRAFELAGDDLAMTGIAVAFSRATGREVQYRQIPWSEFESRLGPEVARLYRWLDEKKESISVDVVRQEYPEVSSLDRWLQTTWKPAVFRAT